MLEGRSYVPLLHTRLAEMRGLRELPVATKSLIFPVIKLRPWLAAKSLTRALEVIEESVGDGLYGLDLDASKFDPGDERQAYQEFSELFDEDAGYSNYYELVADGESRVPVLRAENGIYSALEEQLEWVDEIDRGLFIRVSPSTPGNYLEAVQACLDKNISNVVTIFDCGWAVDILNRAAICAPLVERVLDLDAEAEIVVAGSSFPQNFAGLGERFLLDINERGLFGEVRRVVNRGFLYYGDWGSTRPPAEPKPMKNVPRIDMAGRLNWTCWRSDGEETYEEVAGRVVNDPSWAGSTGIWGEFMIECTADDEAVCIRSPAMAAAVRVNLHLHIQANYDNPDGLIVVDEPVGDDL